jgi:hypothetical protein
VATHHDALQQVGNGATGLGLGAGAYGFLTQNSDVISLGIAASMLVIAVIFYVLNYRLNRKRLALAVDAAAHGKAERRLSPEDLATVKVLLDKHQKMGG